MWIDGVYSPKLMAVFSSGKMSSSERQNGGLKNTKQEALYGEIHTFKHWASYNSALSSTMSVFI